LKRKILVGLLAAVCLMGCGIKTGNISENIKINEYFKEKKNSILDIVMIAQTPIKYDDTELVAKFSLIYFELESGKNIGFFVNKTLASILFTEVGD